MDDLTNNQNELENTSSEVTEQVTMDEESSTQSAPDDCYLPEDEYGNTIYTSEWLQKYTSISGWLGFFLFAVGAGSIISAIYLLATVNPSDYAGNVFLTVADPLVGICNLGVAIYTIYAFNKRKPNAVFFAKLYVIIIFATNILSLIGGEFDTTGLNTEKRTIQGIVFSIIWFIYLCVSKQVEEVIPPSFRNVTKRDWSIAAAVVGLPLLCLGIGFAQISSIVSDREKKSAELYAVPISEHERTDGKIIFTIPYSFSCSDQDVEPIPGVTIKLFSLENDDIGSATLCSDYDDDASLSNFNSYHENWKDDEVKYKVERDIDSGTEQINGNTCFYKVVSYDINGIDVYWRFHLLFDKSSGKVAIVSCYDRNEDTSYVNELLQSIRFK